ncbi:MAG: TraB/GumN family protein [Acidobacteria bacterium]|nr:TraB/GumN family protein [Acidobacteriota bacterium]
MSRVLRFRMAIAAAVMGALAATVPASASGHICLWRIHGRTNTVYLLGSIHMLPAGAAPLDPRIKMALTRSREIVFEIDFARARADAQELQARGMLPPGKTLQSLVPPSLRRRLETELGALGLRWRNIDRMKPWLAAMTLSDRALERAGYDPGHGIDLVLYRRAVKAGKEIRALETAREQIALLDGLGPRQQIGLLTQTLTELSELVPQVQRLTSMWRAGDADGLATTLTATFRDSPELYEALVTARNRRWLSQVLRLTHRDHDILVVVGALHLVGRGGLVSLCRERGLTVTQE